MRWPIRRRWRSSGSTSPATCIVARLQVETDRLRSALLTSISHDLRTPLASILGSATSLRSQDAMLDRPTKEALLGTIIEESDRLNRFIGNLLDMTRLESGALKPRTGLNELSEVIGSRLAARARKSWRGTGSRSTCRRTCRCWRWTWCCSSKCCSTCWTMPPNMRPSAAKSPSMPAATAIPSRCASWTKAKASRPAMSTASSKNSTAPAGPTAGEPERDWVLRSAAASWKPWAERSRP